MDENEEIAQMIEKRKNSKPKTTLTEAMKHLNITEIDLYDKCNIEQ
jgi:hypothetical protein